MDPADQELANFEFQARALWLWYVQWNMEQDENLYIGDLFN